MISSVEEYLKSLKDHLAGSDPALIQDALSDAEEYLRTALSQSAGVSEADTLAAIINKFGTPEEVAAGYLAMGKTPLPAPSIAAAPKRPALYRFFSVFRDMKAWGALVYMFLAMFTGIVYFTWVITGVSLSAGLLVLIVGLPILALFLLSVRLESFLEGRIVETLLGTRMPRRPRFFGQNKGLWQKIKSLFAERTTWTGIVYQSIAQIATARRTRSENTNYRRITIGWVGSSDRTTYSAPFLFKRIISLSILSGASESSDKSWNRIFTVRPFEATVESVYRRL